MYQITRNVGWGDYWGPPDPPLDDSDYAEYLYGLSDDELILECVNTFNNSNTPWMCAFCRRCNEELHDRSLYRDFLIEINDVIGLQEFDEA